MNITLQGLKEKAENHDKLWKYHKKQHAVTLRLIKVADGLEEEPLAYPVPAMNEPDPVVNFLTRQEVEGPMVKERMPFVPVPNEEVEGERRLTLSNQIILHCSIQTPRDSKEVALFVDMLADKFPEVHEGVYSYDIQQGFPPHYHKAGSLPDWLAKATKEQMEEVLLPLLPEVAPA